MQQFSSKEMAELRSRIDQIQELLSNRGDEDLVTDIHGELLSHHQQIRSDQLMKHLMFSIQTRRLRKNHFEGIDLFGPPWDMMLDLMLAERRSRDLSASDLATGAGVPLSSGLRMIAALENAGLARRFIDQRDRRRSLVQMTDEGRAQMHSFFEKTDRVWRDNGGMTG